MPYLLSAQTMSAPTPLEGTCVEADAGKAYRGRDEASACYGAPMHGTVDCSAGAQFSLWGIAASA